ncbi:MAG: nucleotidyltransferase domain-containing protein [bacterium]
MPNKKILDKIIEAILQVVIPDKIILFGSQARGDEREESDYDILVIKSGIIDEIETSQDIYMKLFDVNELISVDVIVATPENVEKYKNTIGCIIKPALKEGIAIYG